MGWNVTRPLPAPDPSTWTDIAGLVHKPCTPTYKVSLATPKDVPTQRYTDRKLSSILVPGSCAALGKRETGNGQTSFRSV